MMTLESAIKHCEEVVEEREKLCKINDPFNFSQSKWKECAKEHSQLAEWLKELKRLREQVVNVIPIPDGATNGDMIKTIFPNIECIEDELGNVFIISSAQLGHIALRECWWSAPYKMEGEE